MAPLTVICSLLSIDLSVCLSYHFVTFPLYTFALNSLWLITYPVTSKFVLLGLNLGYSSILTVQALKFYII